MQGRADRKFCSAACRQKAYRNSRNETATHNVTAEPFPLSDDPVPYKGKDDFWLAMSALPGTLGGLGVFDADADLASFGFDAADPRPVISIYPARRKAAALAEQDTADAKRSLGEFLAQYDEMQDNLVRMKATAEQIAKHHGWS
ncbi:hypothetical protein DAD99_01010 [Pseudarthrobacter sp. AB1]|nr:hypothetical protein [Pseudarthrobacter sp. AB1]